MYRQLPRAHQMQALNTRQRRNVEELGCGQAVLSQVVITQYARVLRRARDVEEDSKREDHEDHGELFEGEMSCLFVGCVVCGIQMSLEDIAAYWLVHLYDCQSKQRIEGAKTHV